MNFSNSSSSSTLLSDVRNACHPNKKAKIVNLLQKIRVYKWDQSHPLNKQDTTQKSHGESDPPPLPPSH
jgi:hypothetical protein